jgi:hypothetical protein
VTGVQTCALPIYLISSGIALSTCGESGKELVLDRLWEGFNRGITR